MLGAFCVTVYIIYMLGKTKHILENWYLGHVLIYKHLVCLVFFFKVFFDALVTVSLGKGFGSKRKQLYKCTASETQTPMH